MSIQKLTKEQAIVITGFTGKMVCNDFGHFLEDVEKRMGRPVWTHEMGNKETMAEIHELYRADFIAMVPEE